MKIIYSYYVKYSTPQQVFFESYSRFPSESQVILIAVELIISAFEPHFGFSSTLIHFASCTSFPLTSTAISVQTTWPVYLHEMTKLS